MMSLKSMPVGYRFHPSDQELVNHYLKYKNQGLEHYVSNIQEIDVCKWAPWELPEHLGSELDNQKEWYFFGRRDSKYVKGNRCNRATKHGFWKPTGKDRNIRAGRNKIIGTKKTLVFHKGGAKRGTQWRMHEYRASVDKDNPQAFVLYLLMNKSNDSSDEADQNISPPCPELPILDEADPNISPPNYPFDSAYEEDDIDLQALQRFFGGQQPTLEELDRLLPAIPVADVYPSQGLTHMTARYLNVSNNDGGVTLFQNINREGVDNVGSASSILMQTRENVPPLVSESGSETVNDVPQSLFGKDAVAVHGGSSCYSGMILAHEVSLSANSDVGQGIELDAEGLEKPIFIRARRPAVTNPRKRIHYQSRRIPVGSGIKSLLGKNNHNMGFMAFAENPRVNDGTIPASYYIMNIAIGIFLTVVITGEVLFGLVSQ